MMHPPKDEDGFVTPHDDLVTIPDDAYLVRYIHRMQFTANPDGTRRLSSGAFSKTNKSRDRYEGKSVDMFGKLKAEEVDPASRMLGGHEAAVLIQAGRLRRLGLLVGPDPMLMGDPFHASVWGVKGTHGKKIRANSEWLIKPSDVV